ncbi:MAG TPA: hypothetical protein VN416_06175 [Desulfomonilia bacterium]|nr:hypothetical protein [Desulfomonilia bacterium]
MVCAFLKENGVSVQQVEGFVKPRHADAFREMHIRVKKGDSLFNLLRGCGIDAGQIHTLLRSVGCEYNLADITPGHPLKILVAHESPTMLDDISLDRSLKVSTLN